MELSDSKFSFIFPSSHCVPLVTQFHRSLTQQVKAVDKYVLVAPLTKLSIAAKFTTFLLGVNRKVPSPKLLSIQLRARGGDKNKNGTSKSTEK